MLGTVAVTVVVAVMGGAETLAVSVAVAVMGGSISTVGEGKAVGLGVGG